jgi:hypothetical protein
MDPSLVTLTLKVLQRDDGSFIATGNELPILLVAADLAGLKDKLRSLGESVDRFLAGVSETERAAYWEERGIEPERVADMASGFSMPVLVGA